MITDVQRQEADADDGMINYAVNFFTANGEQQSVSLDEIAEIVTKSGTVYDFREEGFLDAIRGGTAGAITSITEKGWTIN